MRNSCRKLSTLAAVLGAASLLGVSVASADHGHYSGRHGYGGYGHRHYVPAPHVHYAGCHHGPRYYGPPVVYGYAPPPPVVYYPPPVPYYYPPPVVAYPAPAPYGYPYPPAPIGYYCGHCHYHATTVVAFQAHVSHVHHMAWSDVSASLFWNPSRHLYVFGQLAF